MPTTFYGQTAWAVLIIALAVVLSVVTMVVTWDHARRRARLPDATRYENLREQVAGLEVRLRELQDQLREIDQKVHDRDRLAAEVAALTERRDNLRAEFAALAGAEQQIDAMKQRAAEAVGAFAIETGRLDEVKLALQEVAARLTEAQERLDRLQKDADALEAQNILSRKTLPGEIERLQGTLIELTKQKDAMDLEISDLKGARESLFAARAETAALAARNDALEARYRELRDTLPGRINEMMDQLAQFRSERDALGQEITQLQMARDALLAAREEAAALASRIDSLRRDIEIAREAREALLSGGEIEEARRELARVQDTVVGLKAERASLEQMATKASLEAEIARLRRVAEGGSGNGADRNTLAADLRLVPSCLNVISAGFRQSNSEIEALGDVSQYLNDLKLRYNRRTLRAFHTALKINEISQMTVLAGVSGTGKSLLPRRYAEAMGLRFLQISVEPRWDSPQDLLGFYNYIEKRYRATDLARALVYMDPHNTSGLSNGVHADEVMLVLLDEMNLARVEYYFSEFLSRLEVRPRLKDAEVAERRSGACLSIDIPDQLDKPIRLFPSHNVLFAGTMNDDESTQSLSDKVLDRSNVMQFAAPDQFAQPVDGKVAVTAQGHYRSFREWRTWIKSTDQLVSGERAKADRVIGALARIMDQCGRPFGHRLNEAILAYVVNYPLAKGLPVHDPLVDQIELRILPKLRGLPIEAHEQPLADLSTLIRDELGDRPLARMLDDTVERQRRNGQFNWRGFNRGQG